MPRRRRAPLHRAAFFVVTVAGLSSPLTAARAQAGGETKPSSSLKSPPNPGYAVLSERRDPRTGWRHLHSRFPLPKAGGLAGLMGLGGDRSFEAHTVVLAPGL